MIETREIMPAAAPIRGEVRLPGSKSMTHRALLMAALADGPSEIRNALSSEDTLLTASALRQLGVEIQETGGVLQVTPPSRRWASPAAPIMLGNSGTSMRLLLAVASAGSGRFLFDGGPRLRERPVGPVLDALRALGVDCLSLGAPGCPPVEITSRGLAGGSVLVDATRSSQFLSALLIASPVARSEVSIEWLEPVASYPYVELTLAMMRQSGIRLNRVSRNRIEVPAPQVYRHGALEVEGDCSSASYFWAAAALTGGDILTGPVSAGSLQGDCKLLNVLESMGCAIEFEDRGVRVRGPSRLLPVDLDMNSMPDMVPTLAVLAAFSEGETRIRNVAHLRVKESDRLAVVASELKKFGVPVRELEDGLVIEGNRANSPLAPVDAHDDHRIAMAFAVAGLRVKGVVIRGAESVSKSFPGFWECFDEICGA